MIPMKRMALLFVLLATLGTALAKTEKYRLIWNTSPATSITVAWCQKGGGDATVHYGLRDFGTNAALYPHSHGVDRETEHKGLTSRFARLTGLQPDTVHYFVIRDRDGVSARFSFKTAPSSEAEFSFMAGGDSRNHRKARQNANRTVALLRPLFVCFGGDMTNRSTPQEWADWLDDWELTTQPDGRMTPIIAARGNHEHQYDVHRFFDTPIEDDYYAVDFGNGFLRVYTLNSNIVRAGEQGAWLERDLKANKDVRWKVAHYHHPFRPHTSGKREQDAQYNAWATLFYDYGLNLAIECDSHVVKRTWPVRPSNEPGSEAGFIRDDDWGTVFIGEGCWGAPLRRNDDDKVWTRASASFNQVNWISVIPDQMVTRTVMVDEVEGFSPVDPDRQFVLPKGVKLWEPESGTIVSMKPWPTDIARPSLNPEALARLKIVQDDSSLLRMEIEGKLDGEIRYTSDGSDPDAESTLYSGPLSAKPGTQFRAAVFSGPKRVTAIESFVVRDKTK